MKTIELLYGCKHRPRARIKNYSPDKCYVGFEIEVENVPRLSREMPVHGHDTDATRYEDPYIYKTDGSLRNNGLEIVSTVLPAEDAVKVFKAAMDEIREFDPDYDFSPRTSVHVHVNVLDWTNKELKTFLYLYSLVENLLYAFVAPHRQDNIYCNRILTTYTRLPTTSGWSKYTGLNLCTVPSIGTVEFRQLEGTDDVSKFSLWIQIISDLFYSTKKFGAQPFSRLFNRLTALNTDSAYREFLEEVLPVSCKDLLKTTNITDLHDFMYDTVTYVKAQHETDFERHIRSTPVKDSLHTGGAVVRPKPAKTDRVIVDDVAAEDMQFAAPWPHPATPTIIRPAATGTGRRAGSLSTVEASALWNELMQAHIRRDNEQPDF